LTTGYSHLSSLAGCRRVLSPRLLRLEFVIQGLDLVRITDLGPYILGTRRFEGEENV
jgi:hypothetical protein